MQPPHTTCLLLARDHHDAQTSNRSRYLLHCPAPTTIAEEWHSAPTKFRHDEGTCNDDPDHFGVCVQIVKGLFRLGVWLPPKDAIIILSILDVDNDGQIDETELEAFWHHAPPLRYACVAKERD